MSHRRDSPTPSESASPTSPSHPVARPLKTQTRLDRQSKKREQFSACGACRMRRVRCDLKDLPLTPTGQHPPCSNCRERGLNCIDEFAEVKAVKLLRRGRRLQQVEAVYGKVNSDEHPLHHAAPPPAVIPRLRMEFFDSPFFRMFHLQRPVIEPMEFRERYTDFLNGNAHSLSIPGQLIAMVLVVWAATFGIDEFGREISDEEFRNSRQGLEHVKDMLHEMLYLVDVHGIMRKPSWDGVRLLLLLLPLIQGVQTPIEGLVVHETTLSQIHALCDGVSQTPMGHQDECVNALVRARVCWYGCILDGVTNGLRGGRLLLDDDQLDAFERTLATRGEPSKTSPMYGLIRKLFSTPLHISSVCRQIHTYLTGARAHTSGVNEAAMNNIWSRLDQCWRDLDELTHWPNEFLGVEDINIFSHSWQIYIFECHSVICEHLKRRLSPHPLHSLDPGVDRGSIALAQLYEDAKIRCNSTAQNVVKIIRQNLQTNLFRYDAGFIRDGCFCVTLLLANGLGTNEEVDVCLQALGQMRWLYSKSDERMHALKMVWESRTVHTRTSRGDSPDPSDNSVRSLMPGGYSDVRRHSSRTLNIPSLALVPPLNPIDLAQSAPGAAFSDDGKWSIPVSIPGHSTQGQPGLPAPLISQHPSPQYRRMPPVMSSQASCSTSLGGSLGASSSLTNGPSTPSPAFTRSILPPFYDMHSSYNYSGYEGTAVDHGQSSASSTPTPPAQVRYQASSYFAANPVAYTHTVVGDGPSNDTLQPPARDEIGGFYR